MRYFIVILLSFISFSLRSQKDFFSSDLALSCYRYETPKTSISYCDTNMGYFELIIYPNLNLKRINHYYESGIASDWIIYSKDELLYTIHFNDYSKSYTISPINLTSFIDDYPQKGIKNYDSNIKYKEEEINYVLMLQNLGKKPYPAFENSFCY